MPAAADTLGQDERVSVDDDFRRSVYLGEILFQCEFAAIASQHFNDSWTRPRGDVVPHAFAAAQALLAAAAAVSRLLWAEKGAAGRRAKDLRSVLGGVDEPLLQRRAVRNSLEHFDERLDAFFETGQTNIFDRNIGGETDFMVGDQPAVHLRRLDPNEGTFAVLHQDGTSAISVHMRDLVDAMLRVRQSAADWLNAYERRRFGTAP